MSDGKVLDFDEWKRLLREKAEEAKEDEIPDHGREF